LVTLAPVIRVTLAARLSAAMLEPMKITKFHIPTEVSKLAQGKKTRVSAQSIALAALSGYEASSQPRQRKGDSLAWLERLYGLEDPR
jgi:hypothetical protein